MPSQQSIPVETILKMVLDKSSADDVQRWLDGHEKSWSNVEKSVKNIGDTLEGITRGGLGLVGLGSAAALAGNFFQTSQSGANVALAAGNATGGASTWHPYGQAMLSAQAKTGVNANEISAGLIQALQGAGGNPTAAQASIIGGILAGYGQVSGLTPSQISQVVTPLLQAANRSVTAGSIMGIGAQLESSLSNFPGSQAAPMMAAVSALAVEHALGAGVTGGYGTDLGGIASTINTAAGTNKIWRNPSLSSGAANAISGGLQNAYGNPSLEAFMQMGGISYNAQRKGFDPSNVKDIMSEATRLYGTGDTRDMFLRANFGINGADFLETFSPGSKDYKTLSEATASGGAMGSKSAQRALRNAMSNALLKTTPDATATGIEGTLAHFFEQNPLTAAAGLGTAAFGATLARKGIRGLYSMLKGGAGSEAGDAAGDAGGSSLLSELGGGLGSKVLGSGAGAVIGALLFPGSTASNQYDEISGRKGDIGGALNDAIRADRRKFGKNFGDAQSDRWLENQFKLNKNGFLASNVNGRYFDEATGEGNHPGNATQIEQTLQKLFATAGATGSLATQDTQAARLLNEILQALKNGKSGRQYSALELGSGGGLGTASIAALGSADPSLEFAALSLGSGGGSSGATAAMTALSLSSGSTGASAAVSGGGWSSCTLTWYNPALGGTNSGSGAKDPTATMANGQPYSQTAYTCAAPSGYAFGTQIAFSYGGKSVTATVTDRGGAITGSHFDMSVAAARALGIVSAGKVSAKFKVVKAGTSASGARGSSSGAASGGSASAASSPGGAASTGTAMADMVAASAGSFGGTGGGAGGGGGSSTTHVHVYVDSHKIQTSRVKRGKKS